jgi:hypothetical protein
VADVGEVRLIGFPFGLDPTGAVRTVEQASDAWVEQCIAVGMLTRPGERIQVPSFGVADPAFDLFPVGSLQRHLADFGPEVLLTEVHVAERSEGRERVLVAWEYNEAETTATGETGALTDV